MQPTRHRIPAATKLAASVQHSHDNFDRGSTLFRMDIYWNTSAVIGDSDTTISHQHHVDLVAVPSHRFIDCVVYHFVDEVM